MQPAAYWRQSQHWSKWLGKRGAVIASTMIHVADTDRADLTPYAYAIVQFDDTRVELMGAGNQPICPGDIVECCLRKLAIPDNKGVIPYGIKVKKVTE